LATGDAAEVASDPGGSTDGDRCDMMSHITPAPTAAERSMGSR
jgi:hypothetical protein